MCLRACCGVMDLSPSEQALRDRRGSGIESVQRAAIAQHDASRLGQSDSRLRLELRQGAGNGLDRQTEIVRDVLTRHRQIYSLGQRKPPGHFEQKAGDPFLRALTSSSMCL